MRNVFVSILLLFFSQLSYSQSKFGFKAGTSLYYLKTNNDKTKDYSNSMPGVSFGIFVQLPANQHFTIQPELTYSFQRTQETYYGSKLKTGYFLVPILLKYNFAGTPANIYFGPQFGFLTNARSSFNGVTSDITGNFSRTDFGITAGLGTSPSKGGVNFDVRVFHGLIDVIKSEFDGGLHTRNLLISATIGYAFKKK